MEHLSPFVSQSLCLLHKMKIRASAAVQCVKSLPAVLPLHISTRLIPVPLPLSSLLMCLIKQQEMVQVLGSSITQVGEPEEVSASWLQLC